MKLKYCRAMASFLLLIPLLSGCAATPHLAEDETRLLNDIMDLLDSTMEEAEKKIQIQADADGSAKGVIEELSRKQNYVRQVGAGQLPYDPDLVRKTAKEIRDIRTNMGDIVRELEAKISFGLGRYDISDLPREGKETLEEFVRQSADFLLRGHALFPDNPPVVTIRTVGYADATGLAGGLLRTIRKNTEKPLPQKKAERRQALNKTLSLLRARSVAEFVRQGLASVPEIACIEIEEIEATGAGETFPYSEKMVSPPYGKKDERRRICKVYARISIHMKE